MFERILVVKLADIGDLLTATPALRALRETFPASRISALVTPTSASILEGSRLVDDVLVFDKHRYDDVVGAARLSSLGAGLDLLSRLRRNGYDCVVILHHLVTKWGTLKYASLALASGAPKRVGLDNGRGWFLTHRTMDYGFGFMHEVEYALAVVKTIGAATENLHLDVPVGQEDLAVADRLLEGLPPGPVVVVHPGSGSYSTLRRWPAASFSAVADSLAGAVGASVIVVGGPDEIALCQEVAKGMRYQPLMLAGKTSIKQLAALLQRCDLFVGNDSGVMHIAAAVGTKVVAIFGPSNHRAWAPWVGSGPLGEEPTGRGAIVRGVSPCSPCLYGPDWERRHRRRLTCACDIECLRTIAPDAVLRVARQVLAIGANRPVCRNER